MRLPEEAAQEPASEGEAGLPALPESGEDLTVQQAFELAVEVQKRGYLQNADQIYIRVIEAAPDHLDAMHFMGLGRYRMGRRADGIELVSHVVARDPTNIHACNNLANMLTEAGRLEEARRLYEKVIAQSPEFPAAHANLGAVLRKQLDLEGAEAAFRRSLELDPDHAPALHNLGSLLWDLDRIEEALGFYQRALVLMPFDAESYKRIGASLAVLGRVEEALAVYERWAQLEPNNELPRHMIAACNQQEVPARASDAFVKDTFDRFAESFDTVLGRLFYRAPQLVASAVEAVLGPPSGSEATRDVLDAGAGTGLCGPSLRPYARRLVGMDLSAKMLAKAEARGVYDELATAELTEYMRAHPGAFDVVVSADTLCYFGVLDDAFAAAAAALRPGGHLVFTVERIPPDEAGESGESGKQGAQHRLNPHGRYSHAEDYVRRALARAGFGVVKIDRATLRLENRTPVDGMVVTARAGG